VERLGKGDFVLQEKVGRVRIRKASRREREVGMVAEDRILSAQNIGKKGRLDRLIEFSPLASS
jgi:hypothetical protein